MSSHLQMLWALIFYFTALTIFAIWSARGVKSSSDFIIGNRSLSFWLTAMAAHASDMSSWLFMGYPALIFVGGLYKSWTAVGLIFFMWLNWLIVAPRLRELTGKWNCSTLSSFLNRKYEDHSGWLQFSSAFFCFVFYVVYLCAGLTGLGILGQTLFGFSYSSCILAGVAVVVTYVVLGGFVTLAWIDFIQGAFLLVVICLVPFLVINHEGGWELITERWETSNVNLQILPSSGKEFIEMLVMIFGWGLGYFGQPHIITKFIGIKNPQEIPKSRNLGMAWMIITLAAATLIGLVGVATFKNGLPDPQMVFITMVMNHFQPFLVGLILCSILAATINVMSSQLLILSSILTEDVYKRIFKNSKLTNRGFLNISRLWVVISAVFAYFIAFQKSSSIYDLVHYAWSGLGASFGPLVIASLYSERVNKYGASAAILVGGLGTVLWPYVNDHLAIKVDALIPAFAASLITVFAVSEIANRLSLKKLGDASARVM